MNILLTPELEQFVKERVEKGEYTDALSVITAGLRLLSERELRLAELKAKIKVGISELDRGEGIDGEAVFDELEEDIQQIEAKMQLTLSAK